MISKDKSVWEEEIHLWDIIKILKTLRKQLIVKDIYIQVILDDWLKIIFYLLLAD